MGSRFVVSGEYELLEKLGQGGMGEVFKARHTGPGGFNRIVVIKRILPHLVDDQRFIEMFLAEARLTARLQHPNIVQVLNLGHDRSGYFIASEYVAGHTLSKVINAFDNRQPPIGLGALVVRDVCRALGYAYELLGDDGQPLHLVHRDVSPSNVMIGVGGVAKLLDFGVAKALTREDGGNPATETGVLKGKLWYMAPERMAGEPFDQRADLFSAGVVLHESLTGWRLFTGNSVSEIVDRMRHGIAPPSHLNPAVPESLDRICLKALAPNPRDRFESGRDMAAALDAVLFELKWGASEMAALLRELFPAEVQANEEMALASTVPIDLEARRVEPEVHHAPTAAMPGRRRDTVQSSERTAVLAGRMGAEPSLPSTTDPDDQTRPVQTAGEHHEGDDTRPMSAPPLRLQDHEDMSPEPWARTTPGTPLALGFDPPDERRQAGVITVPTPRAEPDPHVDERSVLLSTGGRPASGLWVPQPEVAESGPTVIRDRHQEPTRVPPPRRTAPTRGRGSALRAYAVALTVTIIGSVALIALRRSLDETVKLQIESEPPGAQFVIGGSPPAEGRTPSRVELPKSSGSRKMVLTLPGYAPEVRSISLESNHTEAVVLHPQSKP